MCDLAAAAKFELDPATGRVGTHSEQAVRVFANVDKMPRFQKLGPAAWQLACHAGCYYWTEVEERALQRRLATLDKPQCKTACAARVKKMAADDDAIAGEKQHFEAACEAGCGVMRSALNEAISGTGRKTQGPPGLNGEGGLALGTALGLEFDGEWVTATLVGFTGRHGLIQISDGDERHYPFDAFSTKWCELSHEPRAAICALGYWEGGQWQRAEAGRR